ncbi:MAG TPA: hypothetical protein VNW71_21165 [Thermoanaerobaculia bacterium]|nr:hypothetical protein [Thermoanaerobaculia bacterium]
MIQTSILLLLLLAGMAPAVAANAPQVTLEVQPATVSVPPQGDADVLVIFRNASDQRLSGLHLSWLTPSGVKVAADSTKLPDAGPFEEVSGTLRVSRDPQRPVPGEVSLRVAYRWLRDGKEVPRIAVAPLKVSLQQPDKIESVASVEVKTTLKSLVEHRPEKLHLVITNTSNEPIDIQSIEVRKPSFISLQAIGQTRHTGLAPRSAFIVAYKVEAGKEPEEKVAKKEDDKEREERPGDAQAQNQPGEQAQNQVGEEGREPFRAGKHLALFLVTLGWQQGGRPLQGTLVASHEIDVGVLGESEILTALGVPTFLVLPGFLMVVTFGLLWKVVPSPSGQARKDFPLAAKSAELWLVAISLSIFSAAVYPLVTESLGGRRSYLEGYGLVDVIRVWMGSILFALVAFLVMDFVGRRREAQQRRREEEQRKRIFTPADTPIAVLRKLKLQNGTVYRDRVNVKLDGQVRRAYLLQRDGDRIWIAPGIRLVGLDQANAASKKDIEGQLTQEGDPGTLADLIEGTRNSVRAEWDPGYEFDGIHSVPSTEVQGAPLPESSLIKLGSEEI